MYRYLYLLNLRPSQTKYLRRFLELRRVPLCKIKGRDLRIEIIKNCAVRTVNFLTYPKLLEKGHLGVGRLHMIVYIETQMEEAETAN